MTLIPTSVLQRGAPCCHWGVVMMRTDGRWATSGSCGGEQLCLEMREIHLHSIHSSVLWPQQCYLIVNNFTWMSLTITLSLSYLAGQAAEPFVSIRFPSFSPLQSPFCSASHPFVLAPITVHLLPRQPPPHLVVLDFFDFFRNEWVFFFGSHRSHSTPTPCYYSFINFVHPQPPVC